MIILAWNGGSLANIFDYVVFKKILSIFITSAILNLGQGMGTWHWNLNRTHSIFLSQGYFSQECWHICVSLSICIGIKWKLKWVDRLLFHAIVHTKNPSLLLFISMYTDFKNTLTQFIVNNCRRFNIVVIFKTLFFSVVSSW